jgi:F-type H+-transporting ATPase subunit alpha
MSSSVADLTEKLQKNLPDTDLTPVITEIGEIVYVGDGVCKIKGLPTASIDDVVDIETEAGIAKAMILGISEEIIEAVSLSDYRNIKQGDVVRSTHNVLKIQSGKSVLGRVIDPLGNPVDGLGPIKSDIWQKVENMAPGVAKRRPVVDQFECGVLVVDTIIPLGKGQRELVIGDRKSGKTNLMASFIKNQKGRNMICVYVAIGAQKAKIRALEQELRQDGAMDYTVIVMGCSDDPPSINYIAPYVGCAIGEYFMYNGKEGIVIYDDLSKHAKAYRQMSLLLKRSPGRDAYPGDIFYLHSRLLERTAVLHQNMGGGSLTGFPVAETQNGDQSEYIVTNLMSITDGHIYLDINLMHEGIFPAVNSGASVSRIGGSVQPPCLRKQGELASTQMARYNEVKSFETLNTEISEDTEREIKRGKRIMEIFSQAEKLNLLNDEKTLLMHIITSGKCDNIEILNLRKIKEDLIIFYRANKDSKYQAYRDKSVTAKSIEEIEPEITQLLTDFVASSQIEGVNLLIEKAPSVEKVLPIVPDPEQQKVPEDASEKPKEA